MMRDRAHFFRGADPVDLAAAAAVEGHVRYRERELARRETGTAREAPRTPPRNTADTSSRSAAR